MSLRERLLTALFPARCVFCGAVIPQGTFACPACAEKAPRVEEPVCMHCGRGKAFCTCRHHTYAFSACAVPYYYENVVKQGLARYKFYGHPRAANGFAAFALPTVQRLMESRTIDLVTAVPLSRRGLRKRGYNQSERYGRALAAFLMLPYAETLQKPFDTKPQHTCGGIERWGNVFGAFTVSADVRDKRLLLADDILTTGATLNECARILLLAGAREVCCTAIACVR